MTFEEIKPDIFDINLDMPTSLPRLERVDSGPVPTRGFVPVSMLYIKSA